MSTPTSSRSSANPTRQQLDDLDALLQRMLELPVNQLDEDAGGQPEPAARPARPSLRAESRPQPVVEARSAPPERPRTAPRLVVDQPAIAEAPRPAPTVSRPRPVAPPEPQAAVIPLVPAAVSPVVIVSPPPPRPAPAGGTLLVWLNLLFDDLAAFLGPLGQWLRRPQGRAALGWTGCLLLGVAVVLLVLDRIGWPW